MSWPTDVAARYRAAGYWTGQTFGELLAERAAECPHQTAIVDGEKRWSYAEFDERASRVATGLADLGVSREDRVVLQLPNIGEFYEVVFALFRLGALPVFALPAHRRAEIGYFCELTGAVAYVIADRQQGFDYRELAAEVCAQVPSLRTVIVVGDPGRFTPYSAVSAQPRPLDGPVASDLAFLQLSGGSTGAPKLIPRTHDDYLYSVRESARICELGPDSRYLVALPAAHNFPMSSPGSLGTFYAGATVVLADWSPSGGTARSSAPTCTGCSPSADATSW